MKLVSQAIFLHRINYGDSSLIITCFTLDKGIRKFIFKGAKKKAQNLFAMAPLELTYALSTKSDLNALYEAQLLFKPCFQESPVKASIAFFMAEVLRKSLPEQQTDERLFLFLMDKLHQLDRSSSLRYLALSFLCELSTFLGITPLISGEKDVFDLQEGILGVDTQGNTIQKGPEVALLRDLLTTNKLDNFDRDNRDKALNLLLSYYAIHIPSMKKIDTVQIIRETLY